MRSHCANRSVWKAGASVHKRVVIRRGDLDGLRLRVMHNSLIVHALAWPDRRHARCHVHQSHALVLLLVAHHTVLRRRRHSVCSERNRRSNRSRRRGIYWCWRRLHGTVHFLHSAEEIGLLVRIHHRRCWNRCHLGRGRDLLRSRWLRLGVSARVIVVVVVGWSRRNSTSKHLRAILRLGRDQLRSVDRRGKHTRCRYANNRKYNCRAHTTTSHCSFLLRIRPSLSLSLFLSRSPQDHAGVSQMLLILTACERLFPSAGSHWVQYSNQIVLSCGVTRGAFIASATRFTNLACLAASHDRNRAPACAKLFSFAIVCFTRFPSGLSPGVGNAGACCSLSNRDGW
mmetsp:Transcript_10857/g.23147  ORF Transcript_10857/g.23147 Transcript_10857/m.23147 type:complete len:342 (-) Transcript_10857:1347-2372(-)